MKILSGAVVFLAVLAFGLVDTIVSASAAGVTHTGTFRGAGGHKSSGGFEIVDEGGQTLIRFKSNFRLNGAPDPKIAFGRGKYVKGTIFAHLRKLRGTQSYVIPKRLDPGTFTQVWLWCRKFNVPLAVASLRKK